MLIISEVPERGSPDTTITGADVDVETGIALDLTSDARLPTAARLTVQLVGKAHAGWSF
jgi:hypothetical protein